MRAFLEGDVLLLGSSISMVHYGDIRDVMGAACAGLLVGCAGTLVFEIPHYWVVEVANVE